jgi:hypothetical protein
VTWALIEDVIGRCRKIEKRNKQVAKALAAIEQIAESAAEASLP